MCWDEGISNEVWEVCWDKGNRKVWEVVGVLG